ncbi:MAG TPA: OmpH family outer membrane protein [Desulfatiglandales bacterium]|nr:OmpH family outer membrane protein [Desulfatiglandales bacterium]
MKKILFVGILFAATFFISMEPIYAADVKIGVIDTQRIMMESRAVQNARAVFLKDVEAKRNIFNAKQKEVQTLQEEIKNKGKDMAASVRKEKTEKLSREIKELDRLKGDFEEELKKKDTELTQKLLKEIHEVVTEYRKKEKYAIIHDKQTLVSYDEAIDITDKIIKLYDVVK